ncbi:MAG: hypothetical protein QG602_3144, partial [Verrucomicrobiota bacterium]|nr:hypothetical protein [Verrucomicrobiota bacterium]
MSTFLNRLLLVLFATCMVLLAPGAEFRLVRQAVGDTGEPLPGASLGLSWGRLGDTSDNAGDRRIDADAQGRAVFTGHTNYLIYAYGATKSGYYPTGSLEGHFLAIKGDVWEPRDQTVTIVLRAIKNPVPMYVARVRQSLPANDVWLGYDLEKGDWLPPHGSGEQRDFEFFYHGAVEDNLNYEGTLPLRIPGEGNGILVHEQDQALRSEFRMPYEAPLDGYLNSWSWHNARRTGNSPGALSTFIDEKVLGRNFIFRVRSVLDAEGKVISACYGKIHSPVILDPRGEHG